MSKVDLVRRPMPKQEPVERVRNFDEVALGYTAELAREEAARCLGCKKPGCVDGCPVGDRHPGLRRATSPPATSPPPSAPSSRPTRCRPSAGGSARRRSSASATACWARRATRWRSGASSASWPTGRPQEGAAEPAAAAAPRTVTPWPWSARGRPASRWPPTSPCGATRSPCSRRSTRPAACSPTASPSSACPRPSCAARSTTCAAWASSCASTSWSARRAPSSACTETFDAVFVGAGAGLPWFLDIPGENLNGVYSANEYLTRCNLMRGFRFPGLRHAAQALGAGGRVRRRQRRHGLGPHRAAPGRRRGAHRLPAQQGRAAGPRRRGRERRGGGRDLRLPHAADAPHRRRARLAHRRSSAGAWSSASPTPRAGGARSRSPGSEFVMDDGRVGLRHRQQPQPADPHDDAGSRGGQEGQHRGRRRHRRTPRASASGPAATWSPARPP